MTEIKIDTVEKNLDSILELVGDKAFVNWESFSQSSSEVVSTIDELNRNIAYFRDGQHRNFIKTSTVDFIQ